MASEYEGGSAELASEESPALIQDDDPQEQLGDLQGKILNKFPASLNMCVGYFCSRLNAESISEFLLHCT